MATLYGEIKTFLPPQNPLRQIHTSKNAHICPASASVVGVGFHCSVSAISVTQPMKSWLVDDLLNCQANVSSGCKTARQFVAELRQRDRQPFTPTCLWTVGGSQSTQTEPIQTGGNTQTLYKRLHSISVCLTLRFWV